MKVRDLTRVALLAAVSSIALTGAALAQDTGTTPDTGTTDPAPETGTTDPAPVSDDTTDDASEATGPGKAVSAQAKTLQDVEGSRAEAAKTLRETALTNNPAYQAAVAKRNANANKTEEEEEETTEEAVRGKSADHPTPDDHPGNDDHPTADDHPDEDSNPGDLASEDRGRPDDAPDRDDHPTPDDHPGKGGGG